MKRRKTPITLIEIIISLGLLAMLLSTLFFWYGRLSIQKLASQEERKFLLQESYADLRLARILQKSSGLFFTSQQDRDVVEKESLVFTFDRGPASDPLLSGQVLGRLYIDKATQELCLGIWPDPKEKCQSVYERLVLLTDVSDLEFSFYNPPDLFSLPVNPDEIGKPKPSKGWQNHWKKDYEKGPALMRLTVSHSLDGKKKRTLMFAFDLPLSEHLVCYPSGIGGS